MALGDVYYLYVPKQVGWHYCVVVREARQMVTLIYGQTQNYSSGAHIVDPGNDDDAEICREFGGNLNRPTHFHPNNLVVFPESELPTQLGRVDDPSAFRSAAQKGFIKLARLTTAREAANNRCECLAQKCDRRNRSRTEHRLSS